MFQKNKLYFVPLGGSGEIGMNLNAYGYNGQWIIVDVGMTFGHELGIELVVPDIGFLADKHVIGIIATHGHEDHIGAIPYLWKKLACPIYATPFTASLIKRKMMEAHLDYSVIETVPLKGRFTLGSFDLEYITLTHSIPEPNALAIRTPQGVIFHTGDWKIDPDPLLGEVTDIETLESLGREGVLALVGDSTNALEDGWSGSEKTVRDEMIRQVSAQKNAVAITCFASNVARLETCAIAAQETGRFPVLVGRSLIKMHESAKACGYLKGLKPMLSEDDFPSIDRSKALIICTGSQGESRAALHRIAFDQHPRVKLKADDTVIFSSRVIPGNDYEIGRVHNQLVRKGVRVITPRQADVHVSGHPYRGELRQMYQWIRPHIAIPVHGELRHMSAHAALALEEGVVHAHVPKNGQIMRLQKDGVHVDGQIEATPCAVDGTQLVPLNDETFRERSKLMSSGVACASVLLGQRGEIKDIYIDCVGIFEVSEDMFDRLERALSLAFEALTMDRRMPSLEAIETHLRAALRREIMNYTGKKAVCIVHVMEG